MLIDTLYHAIESKTAHFDSVIPVLLRFQTISEHKKERRSVMLRQSSCMIPSEYNQRRRERRCIPGIPKFQPAAYKLHFTLHAVIMPPRSIGACWQQADNEIGIPPPPAHSHRLSVPISRLCGHRVDSSSIGLSTAAQAHPAPRYSIVRTSHYQALHIRQDQSDIPHPVCRKTPSVFPTHRTQKKT